MGYSSGSKKIALLFFVLTAAPTFALAVDPKCSDFVKPAEETAAKTEAATKGEPATVEELEIQVQAVLTRGQKIKKFAIAKGTALGLLIVGGISAAYEEEVTELYKKHILQPFRKYLVKWHLTHHPDEKIKLDADIGEFQAAAKKLGGADWDRLSRDEQLAEISRFETRFGKFLTPFKEFASSVDEGVEAKKDLLKGLADQLLPLESIYTDAQIRAADPNLSPANRKAVNAIIASSQTQLDDAVSLWNIYLIGSPVAEKTAFYPGEITKFVQSKEFVLANTDPKAYARSLAGRADEVVKIINGVVQ